MSKAKLNAYRKHDYEILFNDSAEHFFVGNSKMIQEGEFVRFICFDSEDKLIEEHWYPITKIHRIKRYSQP